MRVDGCFPHIPVETVADGYWGTWTNADLFAKVFQDFFDQAGSRTSTPAPGSMPVHASATVTAASSPKVASSQTKVKTPVRFELVELMNSKADIQTNSEEEPVAGLSKTTPSDSETLEDDANVVVNLYREHPEIGDPRDWIYVMTRGVKEVAMSTLNMPPSLTPGVAARRDQHSRRVISSQETEKRKRKRVKGSGSASASALLGKQKCIVLARNSMRSMVAPDTASVNSTRADPDKSASFVEGVFVWGDTVNVDFEVDCSEGKEIRRERVPAARASAFISLSETLSPVQNTSLSGNIVDDHGKATDHYAKLVDAFYRTMMGGL